MGEFASHAQSNLNTVLGSIGTAGALMGGLLNLGGMANNCNSVCPGWGNVTITPATTTTTTPAA